MRNWLFLKVFAIVLLTSTMTIHAPARPARAAAFVVNTLNDVFDGDCNAAHCSLREALSAANAAPTDDLITFSVSGTIAPVGVLPAILNASSAGALSIDGGGNITISGENSGRVFWVNSGGNLTLQNLTIANGVTGGDGGGVANFGALTVNTVTFSNNRAAGGGGVANFNGATLNVVNSIFSRNAAVNGGGGLANYAGGVATVEGSAFLENGSDNDGGGLWNAGSLTVNTSLISANTANNGAGIANFGALSVRDTPITRNLTSIIGKGGAIYNDGAATLLGNIIDANQARFGGGVYAFGSGNVLILKSAFTANRADMNGGGVYNTDSSDVMIGNSTFANNEAGFTGGGVVNNATLTVVNSTLAGNSAPNGGGLNAGGATLQNTLIANSLSGGDCLGALSGASYNNLIGDVGAACGLTNGVNGNLIGQAPNLGALTGAPAYFPLNAGSPAIDQGDNIACALAPVNNESLNGVTRPVDGDGDASAVCDIGAYEAPDATPPTIVSITRADPSPTNAASVNFLVTFSEEVTGVDAGDFRLTTTGSIAGVSVTGVSGAGATRTVTVGTGAGNGAIRLDAPSDATIFDSVGNPLGGLPFTSGEVYTVNKTSKLFLPLIGRSF
ncbi:CSLREA domain-containing protein [Caldilinea sp.]|jgi:CSLREA domain-containing protein|uniref:CSLREA domain-containing protein n=1 Tax=Caldilinea sp. TaxID=2293560 RepID=UPI0021DCFDDB|nr:CSLREA domain-containing protein [Caldilinea sp.]GIV69775.1 MAG: CSLREA domain-containing protein [Caldilinea sp.]